MSAKIRFGILLAAVLALYSISVQKQSLSVQEILDLVNQDREEAGLSALSLNSSLSQAAYAKAEDMILKRYFAHISPEGTKPWFWFRRAGYNYVYAGENLASGYTDSTDLVNSWMSSPSHRANIMSPFYSELGLSIVQRDNRTLVVEFFGSRNNSVSFRQ